MRRFAGLTALCFLLAAPFAGAQEPATDQDEEIVVTAQTLREQVQAFVGELTSRPPGSGQLPRWDRTICPLVASSVISADHTQAAIDRLAVRARELGLETEPAGCRANILVFITHRADELSTDIADLYRIFMRHPPGGIRPPSHREFRAFSGGTRAVNWMYVAGYYSPDGRFFEGATQQTIGVPPSRLRPHARQDFVQVIVVIDAAKVQGVSAHALGDYLALIGLTRIDAFADTRGVDTILNLFADGAENSGRLSAWDEAYLQGTYLAQRQSRNSRSQEREIADSMERRLVSATVGARH